MGIVHHSNYVRWFENARIVWLDRFDQPYSAYVEAGLHFAVTHIEVDYLSPARFDDRIAARTWLEHIGGASLHMGYALDRGDTPIVTGRSEHAAVDDEGRVRRIPKPRRISLAEHLAG